MTSTLLWTLIAVQIALGAFDTLFHHELTERLAWRPSQKRELRLHGVRNLIYAALFLALGWSEVHGVLAIAAVGTAGLRIASNGAEVVAAIQARTGIRVDVISGDEESRLAYLATRAALGPNSGSLIVFDTGGGSSQFTFGHGDHVDERFSVEVGAVRFTERFDLDDEVDEETVAAAREAIADDLSRLDGRRAPDAMIGIGGAVTNLTAVKLALADYDPDAIRGAVLEADEVDRQIELYRTRSAEQRREIVGLQPKRAEVILAGACIVGTVLAKLGRDSLTVSDRGLRHGLMLERFGS